MFHISVVGLGEVRREVRHGGRVSVPEPAFVAALTTDRIDTWR